MKLPPDSIAHDVEVADTFVLGEQLAEVRAARDRLDEVRGSQDSPLANLRYSNEEGRLWRWADSPVDRTVETIVANFDGLGEAERNATRASLTMDDFYTLWTFARRCALAALRSSDASKIAPAFRALAMIEVERIDWRDFLVANWLVRYAGQRLHAPVEDLLSRAMQMAEPQTARILMDGHETQIDLARSCGYREVLTSEGVALFETSYERFEPKADLTGIAYASAVALEANGYAIKDVKVACDIPSIWLGSRDGSAIAKTLSALSGCISLHGVPRADPAPKSSGQSLLVFLAETASVEDARRVAVAAENSSGPMQTQIGLASGRLCAVIIQWSCIVDTLPLEDTRSLERLRRVFERLLV